MRHPPNETPNLPLPEKPKRKLKRIEAHTDEELEGAINKAVEVFGEAFWIMLHGIDAYMTRRKRRDARRHEAAIRSDDDCLSDPWGNS